MAEKKSERKTVTIISRESDTPSVDIQMLADELRGRGIDVNVMCRLLRKEKSLKSLSYIGELARQARAIKRSSVVVVDTYIIPVSLLPHSNDTKVVQTWHALSAIKKFGWQTVGKEGGSSASTARIMRMHKGYDYVVCCSDVTAWYFCDAFGVERSKIVKAGLPRIDYINDVVHGSKKEDCLKRIYEKYPQLRPEELDGKRIVLYAPTFRKGKAVDISGLSAALDAEKYVLIAKTHSLDILSDDAELSSNIIADSAIDSCDWLATADIIVSDYSSFVVEASLAGKPLYIYAYDMDEYDETVGLNIDYSKEAIAPYVFKEADELAKALDAEYDTALLSEFRDKYIDIDTNNCTADLADFIESLM